jgi:threonine dehydrogenase-like Zn-dependent dehydrogenase
MKAARYYGPGNVQLDQVPEPEAKEGQVKIKIAWNGICGSDLHAYLAPVPYFPTESVPNPLTGETLPVTLGHEVSGTIASLGTGVDENKWKVGQNVIIQPIISCLKESCDCCASGAWSVCPVATSIGIGGRGGGLSEYIALDTRYVHILPEGISLDVGATLEPLAVAWYGVKKSGFKSGQTALIVGAGPIGLFLLKVLRSVDPSTTIIVSEPALARRQFALDHGATIVINPSGSEPATVIEAVMKATNGIGVDIAFDAAGSQVGLDSALPSIRPRGMYLNIAVFDGSPQINMNLIVMREITLAGTAAYNGIHPEMLEAVAAGKFKGIDKLITRKIAIEDLVEKGIMALLHEKDKHVKILVHP